jgi:hypothetical protein
MAKKQVSSTPSRPSIISPTPEGRESECISLAYNLVEKRLREGTATSQETVHFLKLGSQKNQYEIERLQEENKLLRAKTEAIKAQDDIREITEQAMRMFAVYHGDSND